MKPEFAPTGFRTADARYTYDPSHVKTSGYGFAPRYTADNYDDVENEPPMDEIGRAHV